MIKFGRRVVFRRIERQPIIMRNPFGVFFILIIVRFASGKLLPIHIGDRIHDKMQMRMLTAMNGIYNLVLVLVVC